MTQPSRKQKIAAGLFAKVPSMLLEQLAGADLLGVYYHMICDRESLHVKHLYPYKTTEQFKSDLDFLMERYSPASLHDLLDSLKRGVPLPEHSFLLTFDDGFREMHDVVAPILIRKGIPATFFLNSAFLDNKSLCHHHKASLLAEHFRNAASPGLMEKARRRLQCRDIVPALLAIKYHQRHLLDEAAELAGMDFDDYLSKHKPYLSSDQVRKLIKDGFTIGAHSIDHPLYSALRLEDQLHQTMESMRFIKERFHLDYGAFAFPHGDSNVSKKFFTEIYRSGLIDVSFGTRGMIIDTFTNNIQRCSLEKPLMSAERVIALNFARKLANIARGRGIIARE